MAMGDKFLASGDYQEALKHYDSAIDPKNPDALNLFRRGVALDGLGQIDRALADYSEAIRRAPNEPSAYLKRGILLASRKRAYDRALADFSRALELAPDSIDALVHRGDAYGQMGDFGRALADLDRAIGLVPTYARAYVYRGLTNGRRGKNQLAVADYTAALKLEPGNVDALVDRAAVYAIDGKFDLALRDLDNAIAIRADDPIAYYNRGYIHFAKRQYELALADYNAAIVLDPKMGLAYNNRCLVRTIAGWDPVVALADCDRALMVMPINPDVRETRGFIYLKFGEPAIAVEEYNAALEHDPNRAIALYGRGLAKIRLNQKKEGEADQAAARSLDPSVTHQFFRYGLN